MCVRFGSNPKLAEDRSFGSKKPVNVFELVNFIFILEFLCMHLMFEKGFVESDGYWVSLLC